MGNRGGRPLLECFLSPQRVDQVERWLQTHGYVVVGVSGISPLPFKVFCLASGVFELDLRKVLGVSLLFRGFRFFSVALLLAWYGDSMVTVVRQEFWLVTSIIGAGVVFGYIGWRRYIVDGCRDQVRL